MELRILGPLEVIGDDGPIGLPAGRPRMLLLALLVRANEPVSVDRLVEDLWSGAPPASAAKIVQGYVGQLRRALGEQRIVTRGHSYQLRVEPGELDVERAEGLREEARTEEPAQRSQTLRAALALFRGPPLQDVADEPFARVERERLAELRLALLIERLEADLSLGRHAELVGEAEALVARHPLDERLRAQLMIALYQSGRQADALTAYADLRRTLADDLGLEPSEELRALQRRILEHDPSLAPPHRTTCLLAQALNGSLPAGSGCRPGSSWAAASRSWLRLRVR